VLTNDDKEFFLTTTDTLTEALAKHKELIDAFVYILQSDLNPITF